MKSIAIFFAVAIATSTAAVANSWVPDKTVDRMTDEKSCTVQAHPHVVGAPSIHYRGSGYAYTAGSVYLLDGNLPLRYAMFRVDRNKAVSQENDNFGIHRDKAAELIAQMRVGTKVLTEYSERMNPSVKLNEFRLEGIGKALDECIAFVR